MKGGWNGGGSWDGKGGWDDSWNPGGGKGDYSWNSGSGKGGYKSGGGTEGYGKGEGRARDTRPASERICFTYRDTGKCERFECPFMHGENGGGANVAANSNGAAVRRTGGAPLPVPTTVTPVGGAILDYNRIEKQVNSAAVQWIETKQIIHAAESTDDVDGVPRARWQINERIHPKPLLPDGTELEEERFKDAANCLLDRVLRLPTGEIVLFDPCAEKKNDSATTSEISSLRTEFQGMITDLAQSSPYPATQSQIIKAKVQHRNIHNIAS